MSIYVIIPLIILFLGIFLIFKFRKNYKLSPEKIKYFNKKLKQISLSLSYKEQITDLDKLYHKILLEAGYNGTFGEILKQEPSEIKNIQKIWELHKLRNKLVHDFDNLGDKVLKSKSDEYKKEIEILLNYFK